MYDEKLIALAQKFYDEPEPTGVIGNHHNTALIHIGDLLMVIDQLKRDMNYWKVTCARAELFLEEQRNSYTKGES